MAELCKILTEEHGMRRGEFQLCMLRTSSKRKFLQRNASIVLPFAACKLRLIPIVKCDFRKRKDLSSSVIESAVEARVVEAEARLIEGRSSRIWRR